MTRNARAFRDTMLSGVSLSSSPRKSERSGHISDTRSLSLPGSITPPRVPALKMPPEKKSSDLHAVFKHFDGQHAMETEMADRPPCFKCVELEKKVQDLQRIINRGAHQHADGMDLMCEMQRVNNETVQAHQKRISTLEAQLHE